MTPSEKIRLVLDYIRTKQITKLFHITLETTVKSRILNGPINLDIEPTSICNARCALCPTPYDKLERDKEFLPMNNFKEIIDTLKNSVRNVNLFVAGDPFINPNLCKMINYTNRNGLRTLISTNGTLLNRKQIDELLDTNLDELYVCLDGAKKESHEKYKRGTNFELICTNIRALTSEKKKRKKIFPYIFVQTLITRYNEAELEDIVHLAKKLGADGIFFKTFFVEKDYDENIAKEFIPKKSLSRYEIVDGKLKMQKSRDIACAYTRTILVLCDGKLAMCCFDYNGQYNIGNAFFQDLSLIHI